MFVFKSQIIQKGQFFIGKDSKVLKYIVYFCIKIDMV